MNIVYGDLLDSITDKIIIPHVCNNLGIMGAGFAKALSDKYPTVKYEYFKMVRYELGKTQIIDIDNNIYIANMIAQNGLRNSKNKIPLNYKALVNCMRYINNKFDNSFKIHCPKFGCGLAGGDWNIIEKLIDKIWSKFNVNVYIV